MVTTDRLGLIYIQKFEEVYQKNNIVAMNGIVDVRPNME